MRVEWGGSASLVGWCVKLLFLGFGEGGEGFYLLGGPNTEGHIICKVR